MLRRPAVLRRTLITGLLLLEAAIAHAAPPPAASLATVDRELATARQLVVTDASRALPHMTAALAAATSLPPGPDRDRRLAQTAWLRAEAALALNHPEEAAAMAGAALPDAERRLGTDVVTGDLLRARGYAAAVLGRVQPALADFQHAFAIFAAAGEVRKQALALQDIGAIYSDAGDYQRMLNYYRQSSDLNVRDPAVSLAAHNNVALALTKMHRLDDAIVEYRRALNDAAAVGSPLYTARVLTSLAAAQIQSGDVAGGERTLARARIVAQQDAAVAGWRPFIWGVSAQAAARRGDFEDARTDLAAAFKGVDLHSTDISFRDFHETAVEVYRRLGNFPVALAHLQALRRLDDQARTLASNTNAALMSARFDFQNQDLKIARLKAGQLQRDVQMARSRASFHRIVFLVAGLLGGALLAVMTLALLVTRRSRESIRGVADQLATSNNALEKALRARTEFLATTSHEIRTPLNGILGMTQVILADPAADRRLRDRIEVVHSAGETMRALVDDILDVAKMEKGEVMIAAAPCSLHAILRDAGRLWSGEAERKGLTLSMPLDGAPDGIVADEQRLRQILFNLLSNAIKFTDAGRVELRCRTRNDGGGDGGAEGGSEWLEITVADTGIGIDPDDHAAIFEAFKQIDGGTTRRFGGTGLGLAICRNLAGAMGGRIEVRSRPGEGATFLLSLPLVRNAGAARLDDTDADSLDEAAVLLIERNPLMQSLMRALLAPACRRVEVAASLDAAIKLAGEQRFSLVLADGATIGDDTATVAKSVLHLAQQVGAGTALVVLIAGLTASDDDRLIAAGAWMAVAKPIVSTELIARLRSAFRNKTAMEAA